MRPDQPGRGALLALWRAIGGRRRRLAARSGRRSLSALAFPPAVPAIAPTPHRRLRTMQTTMPRAGYALDQSWHAERDRLGSLTALYDADTLRLSEQLGLGAGWRCLDVGAGTGSVAELFADRVG